MNELNRYDVNDYHITQTSSVFVTLEGVTLRLQTPKHGIAKRAIIDEAIPQVTFVRQRHFDLLGGIVYLLPSDLVAKRLWSKKYPICIEPNTPLQSRAAGPELVKQVDGTPTSNVKRNSDVEDITERSRSKVVLYLFARTCREKEEWFRRFVAASRGTPWPSHISDISTVSRSVSPDRQPTPPIPSPRMKHRRTGSTDSNSSNISVELASPPAAEIDYGMLSPEQNIAEYVRYMSTVMYAAQCKSLDCETDNGEDPSDTSKPSLVWLNALIGRCFMDFLREKYWAEKMREKIQKKLCKMHVCS